MVNQFGVIPFEVNFKYNAKDTEEIKFNNENPKKISERTWILSVQGPIELSACRIFS